MLELFGIEDTQVVWTSQNEQRSIVEEPAQCLDGTTNQAEDQRQQRDVSVYWTKQDIKENHLRNLTSHFDEVDSEAQLK